MTEGSTPVDLTNSETPTDKVTASESMDEYQSPSAWKAQKALLRQALPVVLLLVISVFVQNLYEIFLFLAMVIAFDSVNSFVIKQSELPHSVSLLKILGVLAYLTVTLYLSTPVVKLFWLLNLDGWTGWFYSGATFWGTLNCVVVVDFLCKYATIGVKCLILMISGSVIPVHSRGRMFMACEGVSQFVRCLLPIPQWSKYVLTVEVSVSTVLCWVLVLVYLFLKLKAARQKLHLIESSCRRNTTTELQPVSSDDMSDEAKLCPICHLGHLAPVKLPCSHVFCRNCISLWFDREQHCPQCGSLSINSIVLGLQSALPPVTQYTSSNSKWKTGTTDYVIQMF